MKKLFLLLALISVFLTGQVVVAKQDAPLPEQEGIYDVPGNKNLKLRVFVYREHPDRNNAKPAPSATPSPACGLTDPDTTSTVAGAGWIMPSSWEYRLNPSSVPASVGSTNLPTIASNSFAVWSSAQNNAVSITRGTDTTKTKAQYDGQNIVTWGRASGSALAVSYIWYTNTGTLVEVDTIMNSKFSWAWYNPVSGPVCAYQNVYDAQNIMTHEFGHTVGLNDHYTDAYMNATMYGYGSKTEVKKDTLTTGDIAGVQAIY